MGIDRLYIIRHNQTGLYSRGGNGPEWAFTPKVYTLKNLKQHLILLNETAQRTGKTHPYADAAIIEFEPHETARFMYYNIK